MCCFPHYTINPKFFQVKYSAPAECEIISFENCEISPAAYGFGRCEMKFAHIREANISHLRSKYFTAKLFHLPEGQISLKKAKSYDLAFFLVETTRFELVTPCMSSKYSNQLSYASKRFFNRRALLYHSCFQKARPFLKFLVKIFNFFLKPFFGLSLRKRPAPKAKP